MKTAYCTEFVTGTKSQREQFLVAMQLSGKKVRNAFIRRPDGTKIVGFEIVRAPAKPKGT